jgi:hypothetical protein
MPEIPRIVLAPVEYIPVFSIRFALRCTLCLVLTAVDAGVIAFVGIPLCQVTAGQPLQIFGVIALFAALLGSLIRVWSVAFRNRNR